jgi:hypothetical protein
MCPDCAVPFYDMRRQPITCPKCGAKHQPVVLLKSDGRPPRRNRLRPTLVTTPAVEPALAPVAAELDPETDEEVEDAEDEDVEDSEDEKEDAALTEAEPNR